MWKEYSDDFIKNNRSSSLSIRISAFISALLLSLLCGLFYNLWKYDVERIELEHGSWQSRIIGEFSPEAAESIKNFAHVKDAVVNVKESSGTETAIDIYFDDYGAVFSDTPRIAEQAGIPPEKVVYNYELLAMYLIRGEGDTAPRLVFPMFILITALASLSLVVVIHNSFSVSMNSRIHQFGIFSSIGATPKQIRACLLHEAAALCAVPVLAGNLLGIAGSLLLIYMTNVILGSGIPGRHESSPGYHPLVFLLTLVITIITIWVSAWLPARKLSRLTPLEAIKNTGDLELKRRKNSYLLALLFGVEGELAGNALKAQRRALRTASLSFAFSFTAFTIMQCFFALSGISTRETYFERYQDVWDIMVTVKDTRIQDFTEAGAVQGISGAETAIVYQKAAAKRFITEEEISEEMKSNGGFSHASDRYAAKSDGGWLVNAPTIILDDASFTAYCNQIGIPPRLDGAIVINQIRDVTNPDFRHPDFMPYLKTDPAIQNLSSSLIHPDGTGTAAEIPILSYIRQDEAPALREEYATLDYYELVHFLPSSLWKEIQGQAGKAEKDTYICILGKESAALEDLDTLQAQIEPLINKNYSAEYENRIREYEINNKQIQGIKAVFGGFCALFAVIGMGNVFSNALGFVRQRKREFARYMSIGLAPGELKKMFCIEALVLAGRPILITLPTAAIAVGYMLKASYVGLGEFLAEAPLIPISVFMLAVLGSVALAYFCAWRNVRNISLAEVLRDDTMM